MSSARSSGSSALAALSLALSQSLNFGRSLGVEESDTEDIQLMPGSSFWKLSSDSSDTGGELPQPQNNEISSNGENVKGEETGTEDSQVLPGSSFWKNLSGTVDPSGTAANDTDSDDDSGGCAICWMEFVADDDRITCNLGLHSHCKSCVSKFAVSRVEQGFSSVACMDPYCKDGRYSLDVLQKLLAEDLFRALFSRTEQSELRGAKVENKESCPFCGFFVLITDPNATVFVCPNSSCRKKSCRKCWEEEHSPVPCNEVEKGLETKRRVWVEESMSKAVIRSCPQCATRLVKESGCNHVRCSKCRCEFCYMCLQAFRSSDAVSAHFRTACQQSVPIEMLHGLAAKRAGEEALRNFNATHPELAASRPIDINKLAGV